MRFILFALLASCLSLGLQAETLFEQKLPLAKAGNKFAQWDVGIMYKEGSDGAPKNLKMAAYWYGQSAKQGYVDAQFRLGAMYHIGEGVPQDSKEAVKWWTKAAQQGHAGAQHNLGVMYYKGEGMPQDYKEAVKWYTKAAQQGHAGAQYSLGSMYANGEGVIEDYVAGYAWTIVAKANGHDAENNLRLFKRDMTPQQIAIAQALAKKIFQKIENKDSENPINVRYD